MASEYETDSEEISDEEIQTLTLQSQQINHFNEIKASLKVWPVFVSQAQTGSGKTYVTSKIYEYYKNSGNFNKMVVFGPPAAKDAWIKMNTVFGMDIEFVTYFSLAGSVKTDPYENYLVRGDGTNKNVGYTVGKGFSDLIGTKTKRTETKNGEIKKTTKTKNVFIVFDEIHLIKKGNQLNAVTTLIRYVIASKSTSRCGILTATPFDRAVRISEERGEVPSDANLKEIIDFLRIIGIIRRDDKSLYSANFGNPALTGLEDVIKTAKILDKTITKKINSDYRIRDLNPLDAKLWAWKLYRDVIGPKITSSMEKPPSKFEHLTINYVIAFEKGSEEEADYEEAMQEYYDQYYNSLGDYVSPDISQIKTLANRIESYKLKNIAEMAMRYLNDDKKARVLIMVNSPGNISILGDLLEDYEPLMFESKLSPKNKTAYIEAFAENKKYRLLIGTSETMGVSKSMHDEKGGRKTYTLVTSGTETQNKQAIGRTNRVGVKSDTKDMIVYGPGINEISEGKFARMIDPKTRPSNYKILNIENAEIFSNYEIEEERYIIDEGEEVLELRTIKAGTSWDNLDDEVEEEVEEEELVIKNLLNLTPKSNKKRDLLY